MTVEDLLAVKGVSDPQLSPDGSLVVYVVSELDRATQKNNSSLWLVPASGGAAEAIDDRARHQQPPALEPRRQVDRVRLEPGRLGAGLALPIDGGEARQLTKLPIDVSGPIWSPQGDKIAFTAEVYPGLDSRADRRQGQGEGSLQEKGPHL